LALIWGGISPNATVAAIEPAGSAIVRATVWHWALLGKDAADAPALYQKFDCGGHPYACNLLAREQICYIAEKKYAFYASCRNTLSPNILKAP